MASIALDSARGADNVNISRASGMSSSTNGAGANNEAGRVVRDKDRNRRDRQDDTAASGEMAAGRDLGRSSSRGRVSGLRTRGRMGRPRCGSG